MSVTIRCAIVTSALLASGIWLHARAWAQEHEHEAEVVPAQDAPWSAGIPPEQRRRAGELFLAGNDLLQIPLFAKAAAKYEEAIALVPHPAFYYNLGLAQINLDQPVAAYENLQRGIGYGDGPLGKRQYQHALTVIRLLEGQLGRIEVICAVPGAVVALNGKRLFTGPGRHESLVRAGDHQVTASRSGYLAATEHVAVQAGEMRRVVLTPMTLDQVSESSRRWAAWKPWAVVGGGTTLALVGATLHWRSSVHFEAYDASLLELECITRLDPGASGCARDEVPARANDQFGRAELQQRMAVASYVAGGVTIAAGLVLVYLNRPRLLGEGAPEQSARVVLSPHVEPGILGVLAGYRF